MKVATVEGQQLGEIDAVIPMARRTNVIQIGELLIPAVSEFVKDIDLEATGTDDLGEADSRDDRIAVLDRNAKIPGA